MDVMGGKTVTTNRKNTVVLLAVAVRDERQNVLSCKCLIDIYESELNLIKRKLSHKHGKITHHDVFEVPR